MFLDNARNLIASVTDDPKIIAALDEFCRVLWLRFEDDTYIAHYAQDPDAPNFRLIQALSNRHKVAPDALANAASALMPALLELLLQHESPLNEARPNIDKTLYALALLDKADASQSADTHYPPSNEENRPLNEWDALLEQTDANKAPAIWEDAPKEIDDLDAFLHEMVPDKSIEPPHDQQNVPDGILNPEVNPFDEPKSRHDDDLMSADEWDAAPIPPKSAPTLSAKDKSPTAPTKHKWGLWIGILFGFLVALGGLYFALRTAPEPIAVSAPAPIATQDGTYFLLSLNEMGGIVGCRAQVSSMQTYEALQAALSSVFVREGVMCLFDVTHARTSDFDALDKMSSVMAILRTVPFASLEYKDGVFAVYAPSDADALALATDLGAILSKEVIANASFDRAAFVASTTDALLAGLDAPPADFDALIRKLNYLPFSASEVLTQAQDPKSPLNVFVSKAAPHLAKANQGIILAMHDSSQMQGAAPVDSQNTQAANTIRALFVAAGVPKAHLMVVDAMGNLPRTNSATAWGQAMNTRAEFWAYDTQAMALLTGANSQSLDMPYPYEAQTIESLPVSELNAYDAYGVDNTYDVYTPTAATPTPANTVYEPYVPPYQSAPVSGGGIPDDLLAPVGVADAQGAPVQQLYNY